MIANIIFEFILKGGLIMVPMVACGVVAVAVVFERTIYWLREARRRDPQKLARLLTALCADDMSGATQLAADSQDPVLRMIHVALGQRDSLTGNLQLAASSELKRAARFLNVLDTLVTLAPLLGLLGTVTGLMQAFLHVGDAALAVSSVTGGIGVALVATACGLGIAIFALIPYNIFCSRVSELQFDLETAATRVEMIMNNPSAVKFHSRSAIA
jgi:biopolymer transport protein ExbB